ncbi:hypothetical protein BaRGS_00033266 [Batillaria attramentaria]|uniref:Uncharacterized protein n=1 Tax=Batillaria attramentaria TaxID=370345 RepID=A0ABD0JLF3_9CAEN
MFGLMLIPHHSAERGVDNQNLAESFLPCQEPLGHRGCKWSGLHPATYASTVSRTGDFPCRVIDSRQKETQQKRSTDKPDHGWFQFLESSAPTLD